MFIVYENKEAKWSYYFVRTDRKTYIVWPKDCIDYKGTTYEQPHKKGEVKSMACGYPVTDTEFFNRVEAEKGWVRVKGWKVKVFAWFHGRKIRNQR